MDATGRLRPQSSIKEIKPGVFNVRDRILARPPLTQGHAPNLQHTAQPSAPDTHHAQAPPAASHPLPNTTPHRSNVARAIGPTHSITQPRADVLVVVEDVVG